MASNRSLDGLGVDDHRIYRLYKVVSCEARRTLYFIFVWGCKRDPTKSLEKHLKDTGISDHDYNRLFQSKFTRKKINDNPSGKEFDVTLLFEVIQKTCSKLAPKDDSAWKEGDDTRLESICTSIKNFRNTLIHSTPVIGDDAEMSTRLQKLQDLLVKALQLGGTLYKCESSIVDKEITEMNNNIKKIMDTPLSVSDKDKYQKELKELREGLKHTVNEVGVPELCCKYKNKSKIDPASFITGKESLEVKKIFTKPEVIREKRDTKTCENVDYKTILELTTEDGNKPTVLLLEGEAGAGKTTLVKLILDSWADWKNSGVLPVFQSLQTYHLILYTEARNRSLSSFLSLLTVLMSDASYTMNDEDLERSVLNLEVLLIIDGLDELNDASRKLLNEVFEKHIPRSHGKLHLLITTRPNVSPDLPSLLHNEPRVHIVLRGVTQENRVEFMTKLHDEMIVADQSQQKTQDLVHFIKQSQACLEQYRLPLNLTLVTYLFASDPDRINLLTTTTELYIAMNELRKSHLLKRLQDQAGGAPVDPGLLGDECELLKMFYHVCLQSHASGHIEEPIDCTEELKGKCKELHLTFDEMCSAFLAVQRKWTPGGYKLHFYVPHRSIVEFNTAYRILLEKIKSVSKESRTRSMQKYFDEHGSEVNEEKKTKIMKILLEDDEVPLSLSDIMKNLGIDLDSEAAKVSNYQNVFLHLSGLMAQKCPTLLSECAEELVDLLHKARMKRNQWLNVVVETKCNEKIAERVASHFFKKLTIREYHIEASLKVLKYLSPDVHIIISLENEEFSHAHLNNLLDELSCKKFKVDFRLKYQWKYSHVGTSDEFLKCLTKSKGSNRCTVSSFKGYLESLEVVPQEVKNLAIAIASSDHAKSICYQLRLLMANRQQLQSLCVHVMKGVSPESLQSLPVLDIRNTLLLSDVKTSHDVTWACKVAQALLPQGGQYSSIMFPRSTASFEDYKDLVIELKNRDIKVKSKGGIRLCSPGLTDSQKDCLRNSAKENLNCEFYCSGDESCIW